MNTRIVQFLLAEEHEKFVGTVVVELVEVLVTALVLHDEQGLFIGLLRTDAEHAMRRQVLLQLLARHPEILGLARLKS